MRIENNRKNFNDEEIDLRVLISVLYKEKRLIIIAVIVSSLIAVFASLMLPNIYKSEALLAYSASTSGSQISGSSGIGGLASLAGINIGGLDQAARKNLITIETLKSRKFFSDYLYEKVLLYLMATDSWDANNNNIILDPDIYDSEKKIWIEYINNPNQIKPSVQESYNQFSSLININEDELGGVINLSVEHKSPHIAKYWVDLMIESINIAMRKKDTDNSMEAINFLVSNLENTKQIVLRDAFSNLIEEQTKMMMLANISDEYALSIIDPAVVAETKSSPRRSLIVVLGSILGFFFSILFVLMREYFY